MKAFKSSLVVTAAFGLFLVATPFARAAPVVGQGAKLVQLQMAALAADERLEQSFRDVSSQLRAARQRNLEHLANLEKFERGRKEAASAINELFDGVQPSTVELAQRTHEQVQAVAVLMPKVPPTPEREARSRRIAELNRLMRESQTRSGQQYRTIRAAVGAEMGHALADAEETARAEFAVISVELRSLQAQQRSEVLSAEEGNNALQEARALLTKLIRIGELADTAKLVQVSRASIEADAALIAGLEASRAKLLEAR